MPADGSGENSSKSKECFELTKDFLGISNAFVRSFLRSKEASIMGLTTVIVGMGTYVGAKVVASEPGENFPLGVAMLAIGIVALAGVASIGNIQYSINRQRKYQIHLMDLVRLYHNHALFSQLPPTFDEWDAQDPGDHIPISPPLKVIPHFAVACMALSLAYIYRPAVPISYTVLDLFLIGAVAVGFCLMIKLYVYSRTKALVQAKAPAPSALKKETKPETEIPE